MELNLGLNLESLPLQRKDDPNRNASRSLARQQRRLSGDYSLPKFIGVDGEGVSNGQGGQHYALLGVGSDQIEDRHGLSFPDIMGHLYRNYRDNPEAAFVGFYLGYDFAHWLKGIPEGRARILLTSEGIESRKRRRSGGNPVPFPVNYGGWEFDILGMKRFKLRPACCEETWRCKHKRQPWMYVCDAGPFFQTSLLKAIDPRRWPDGPIVTDAEYADLVAGKTSRGVAILDDEMRRYNALENVVLGRLMEKQAGGLRAMGIGLSRDQWYGPGQASAEWMKQQRIPRRKGRDQGESARFQELARRSYYGGWFEIFMHGKVRGTSYGYDINSAYPHIMSRLPCLQHGVYAHGKGKTYPPDGLYTLCSATVRGEDAFVGAALHRSQSSRICRPQRTRGIYWLSELEAGKRAGVIDSWTVRDWWSYAPCDCLPPLANLARLYEYRRTIGKDTAAGKAAKLIYNSAYGKFAQSIGNAPFGNWIYASLTTSGCRSMILDAIATHPGGTRACEMVATDGIFFTTPHPTLPISENLGDWEQSEKEGLVLYKPGFYWDAESKGKATYRSRGIRAADFADQIPAIERDFDRILAKAHRAGAQCIDTQWPAARFNVSFSITSPLVALRRNDWSQAANVSTDNQFLQGSDPRDKRVPLPFYDETRGVPILRTMPYVNHESGLSSRPYDKQYADSAFPSDDELGITPDGDVAMEWTIATEELRGE